MVEEGELNLGKGKFIYLFIYCWCGVAGFNDKLQNENITKDKTL